MLVIFEGQDKTGKSTTARRLAEAFGAEYQHYSKPDIDPYEYFSKAVKAAKTELIICDRHLLGEKIYAKVKKTPSQWKEGDYEKMLSEINEMGAVIVITHEPFDLIKRRHKKLGETFITPEEGMKVQALFLKEAKRIAAAYPRILVMKMQPSKNIIESISKIK